MKRVRLAAILGAALLALMLLAACEGPAFGGSDEESMLSASEDFAAAEPAFAAIKQESGPSTADTIDRQIIREARINIEVEDVETVFARVGDIARASGGFVADSSIYAGPRDGRGAAARAESAYLRLRIPADNLDNVRTRVAEMAETVLSQDSNSQDVTMQVADYEARLRNLRATERQYLELLTEADDVEDVVLVTDRLSGTRGEIERIDAQLTALASLVDLSTLYVDIQRVIDPEEEDVRGPLDAAREGWDTSWRFLEAILETSLAVIAFSWWLLPPLGLVLLIVYLRRRSRSDSG